MHSYSRQPRVEFRKKPRYVEQNLQKSIVALWKKVCKVEHGYDKFLVASMNGLHTTKMQRIKGTQSGMVSGEPDLSLKLPWPEGTPQWLLDKPYGPVAYFEVKKPQTYVYSEKSKRMVIAEAGGVLSPKQKDIHQKMRDAGHKVTMINNVQEFMDWVKMNAKEMLKA